jgi:hypothetical protein
MLRVCVYCLSRLFLLGEFAKLQKATVSFIILSVPLSAWNNSAAIERVIMKFDIRGFFENLSKTFKFHYNLTRTTATFHEDLCTFTIVSR